MNWKISLQHLDCTNRSVGAPRGVFDVLNYTGPSQLFNVQAGLGEYNQAQLDNKHDVDFSSFAFISLML